MSSSNHKTRKKTTHRKKLEVNKKTRDRNHQEGLMEESKKLQEDQDTQPIQKKVSPTTISLEQTETLVIQQSQHNPPDEEAPEVREYNPRDEDAQEAREFQTLVSQDAPDQTTKPLFQEQSIIEERDESTLTPEQDSGYQQRDVLEKFDSDSSNWSLDEFGDYLKSAREMQGLEIVDITRATNIHQNFILAIEEGAFSKLPNKTIAQGFYSSCAKFLGIYSDELKINFNKCLKHYEMTSLEPEKIIPESLEETQAHKPSSSKASRKTFLIFCILALVGILMLSNAFLLRFFDLAETETNLPIELSTNPQQQNAQTEIPIVQNTNQQAENNPQNQLAEDSPGPFLEQEETKPENQQPQGEALEFPETTYSIGFLVSEGESWYRVTDAEDRILEEGTLKQGEKLFKDFNTQTFWILGNADKILFTLEDKPTDLKDFTNKTTKVANFTIQGRNFVSRANRRIQTPSE